MEIEYSCPVCNSQLERASDVFLKCIPCNKKYPICGNIPILINEEKSVFCIKDFLPVDKPPVSQSLKNRFKSTLIRSVWFLQRKAPSDTLNLIAKKNYAAFADALFKKEKNPKVLVIGGKTLGQGMEDIIKMPITFIEADIAFGPNTKVICDAQYLPFKDKYFDGVIIQAVLEYLIDPAQCVSEIHRVLKDDMLVYAETPFMQQNHGREYDFTRYTHLGFIRLFRNFEEIDSGACVGTGSALASSYKYFILSFTNRNIVREILLLFASYTCFLFKYFDHLTINNRATLDAASGVYFLGVKSNKTLADKELVMRYRGMV